MKIQNQERVVKTERTVFIDPNPRKEREMLDKHGNVIDPRTKQILKKADSI